MFNDRPFKFYAQLKREQCKFSYTQWPISGRDPVSHSHWIYVCSLYMSMFTLTAV